MLLSIFNTLISLSNGAGTLIEINEHSAHDSENTTVFQYTTEFTRSQSDKTDDVEVFITKLENHDFSNINTTMISSKIVKVSSRITEVARNIITTITIELVMKDNPIKNLNIVLRNKESF